MQHSKEVCHKCFYFLPNVIKLTLLQCENRKAYFSSLQRYDIDRNVTDSARSMQSWNATSCVRALFQVTSLCTNTGNWVFLPLITCCVCCAQLEASPCAHHLLQQICHILYIDTFLHLSPNAVINQFHVGWPHVGSSEFVSLMTKQLTDVHDEVVHCPAESCKLHRRCSGWLVTPSVNEILSKFIIFHIYRAIKFFLSENLETQACCKLLE